jgi:filamentous hemagglutinin family protein
MFRSADCQSAVSRVVNLRGGRSRWHFPSVLRVADWQSAIQQVGNQVGDLRYRWFMRGSMSLVSRSGSMKARLVGRRGGRAALLGGGGLRGRAGLLSSWLAIVFFGSCLAGWSQISLDGSLGRSGPLTGPNFQITATLGRQVGANLFHSFSEFNLKASESATFSGPVSVANILSRVTGTSPSSIEGTLRSTIPGANLFLMNPHGIVFGKNAALDVSGSFAATSADYIALQDGGRFDASNPGQSLLTGAAPSAYGFVDGDRGFIRMEGGQLNVPAGKFLHLVGGESEVTRGTLQALEGEIRLQGVLGPAEVPFTPSPALEGVRSPPLVSQEKDISIRGGQIILENAKISASTSGDAAAGNVTLTAADIELQGSSRIAADTSGQSAASTISIQAGKLGVSGGSQITADTSGAGAAGRILVRAGEVDITGISTGEGHSGLFARSLDGAGGPAGNVDVLTGSLTVRNGGQISTDTFTRAQGGNLSIQAQTIVLDGTDSSGTGLFTGSRNLAAGGRAGKLQLEFDDLQILNGGQIEVSTKGSGDGGELLLTGRTIEIDGQNAVNGESLTGIVANSDSKETGGRAGDLRIEAITVAIRNRGPSDSGIFANTKGAGDAGNLDLEVDQLTLDHGATITSKSDAQKDSGVAGQMRIRARENVSLAGGSSIVSDSASNAGLVSIEAGSRVELRDSSITATATGDGGRILITAPDFVILNRGNITANSQQGTGGRIRIDTGAFVPSTDSKVTAASKSGQQGNVTTTGLQFLNTEVVEFTSFLPEETPKAAETNIQDTAAAVTGYVVPGLHRMEQDRRRLVIGGTPGKRWK